MNDDFLEKVFGLIPTPGIILKADAPKFTIAFVNEAYEYLSQSSKNFLIGKGFFEAFPEMVDQNSIENAFSETIKKRSKTFSPLLKYWLPDIDTKENKLKYLNSENTPIFNKSKEVEYILRYVTDVTDSVVLDKNEIILANAGIVFWEFNPITEIISWQENYLKFSLEDRNALELILKRELVSYLKILGNNKTHKYFSFESLLKSENLNTLLKVSAKIIINYVDAPIKIMGAVMQIKNAIDNKPSENINKNSSEFVLDFYGNFNSNNNVLLDIYNKNKNSQLKAKTNICELLNLENKIPFLDILEKATLNPNKKYRINLDFVDSSGELFSFLLELFSLQGDGNEESKIICRAYAINSFANLENSPYKFGEDFASNSSASDFVSLDWDIQNNKINWHPDFFEFFGFENIDHFTYETWESLVHKDDAGSLNKSLTEALENQNQNKWFASYQLKMPDSSSTFVEFSGYIIRDKGKKAIYLIGTLKDISKQKLSETHLKLLESFIQNTNDAVMISEPDKEDLNRQKIVYVNEAFVKMSGFSSEESLGKNPRFLKGLDPKSPTYDKVYNSIRQRKYLKVEIPYKKRCGIPGWASLSMHPIFNDSGTFINWVSIAHDITEKKTSQINLSYRSKLIETISIVNSSLLQHSKYLEVMDNSFKVVGEAAKVDRVYYFELAKSEKNRRFFHKRLEWTSAECRSTFKDQEYPRSLLKQFLPELLLNKNFSGITNNLEDSPFKSLLDQLEVKSFLLFPLFVQNKLYGIIGFDDCKEERVWIEDEISFLKTISLNFAATIERQISSEILKLAYKEKEDTIESLQDGFFSISHSGIITFWNEEAENIAKITKENVIGKNFLEIFSDKLPENILSYYNQSWDGMEPLRIEEYFAKLDKWLELSVFPTQAGISGYFKDVTHRKLGEKKLTDLHKELKTNLKELSFTNLQLEQFAYIASHDLQEPLRMVTSFLTLLDKKYSNIIDEKGKKYIYHAVDGAKRMRQIILDLLEYSRVGQVAGNKEEINLNDLIEEVRILYSNKIRETNAEFNLQRLPTIKSYSAPIKQIFQNIISNSLKYHHTERLCKISIRYKSSREFWIFEISDNGIGISQEYYDKIFIIFQRLHSNNVYSGSGLGLATTKKIVESLGGKIWVKSKENVGSSFYFTLPKV